MPTDTLLTREAVEALPVDELLQRYSIGVERFDRRVVELTEADLDTAFLPEAGVGRWPARVLLGHLADAEIFYTLRMRRTVGEESPLLHNWDEQAFVDSGIYSGTPIGAFIALIHTLRRATGAWLITLPGEAWDRRALHELYGPMTLRKILAYDTWHLEHHACFLNRKIVRFLGPAEQDRAAGTRCGPHCGCG